MTASRSHPLRTVLAGLGAVALVAGLCLATAGPVAAAGTPRLDLRVLVVTDGTPWVDGVRQELATEGVPTTVVNLADTGRPQITAAYLADQLANGTPHAKFNGVVLPSEAPSGLAAAELSALASFEQQFGVRQVDSFVYPSPAVGLNYPTFAGRFDGATTTLTSAALGDAFRYLAGPVTFEDNDPAVDESYAYLTTALPDDPATGAHFEPFLTGTAPGGGSSGVLAGVYRSGGREQLVIGAAYNYSQRQFRALGHGIVEWVTRGVHLGYWRNYLTVHIDDVLTPDSRWSTTGHCTPGEGDCAAGVPDTTPIRMTAADVSALVTWQQQNNLTLDMLFNAAGSDQVVADTGSDPLATAFLANKSRFRWVNHTYSHQFLGCLQDFGVIPWRCQTDSSGQPAYLDQATINGEITNNLTWASAHGLTLRRGELVAGEHSGTKILPQQPTDNPNFVASLTGNQITWLGLDASRETAQRQVGSALGVPRHPINLFFNVATAAEEVSEYNWIYTSRANGGSGICEDNPATTTCITPLSGAAAYTSSIVPTQTQIMLGYLLSNDPRPFYLHQSNLTEDRLAYPVLTGVLSAYRGLYATNTPVVNQTLTAAGQALQQQAGWTATQAAGTVSAYLQGSTVTVTGPRNTAVPLTAPTGTRVGSASGATFGSAYGGAASAYTTLGSNRTLTVVLPTAWPATGSTGSAAATPTAPATATTGTTGTTGAATATTSPTAAPGTRPRGRHQVGPADRSSVARVVSGSVARHLTVGRLTGRHEGR